MKSAIYATFALLVFAIASAAQSVPANNESFSWNAELVALDAASHTLSVKAPVVYEEALAAFGRLKAGERVMLTWSGYDKSADAIRAVKPVASAGSTAERFTFPAEFVAFDKEHRHATFKIQIPANGVDRLKSLKPGEWVTATSPHGSASKMTPVVAVRPYVESATAVNSN
jgi:hypothetical protein